MPLERVISRHVMSLQIIELVSTHHTRPPWQSAHCAKAVDGVYTGDDAGDGRAGSIAVGSGAVAGK